MKFLIAVGSSLLLLLVLSPSAAVAADETTTTGAEHAGAERTGAAALLELAKSSLVPYCAAAVDEEQQQEQQEQAAVDNVKTVLKQLLLSTSDSGVQSKKKTDSVLALLESGEWKKEWCPQEAKNEEQEDEATAATTTKKEEDEATAATASDEQIRQQQEEERTFLNYADRHARRLDAIVKDDDCMKREFDVSSPDFDPDAAARVYSKCRLLVLRNVFDAEFIRAYKRRYDEYVWAVHKGKIDKSDTPTTDARARDIVQYRGRKRHDIMLPRYLADQRVAMNKNVIKILSHDKVLGRSIVPNQVGSVIAESGAPAMYWHEDQPYIYGPDSFANQGIGGHDLLPYVANLFVPLFSGTAQQGPTEFCVGATHLLGLDDVEEQPELPPLLNKTLGVEGGRFHTMRQFRHNLDACPPEHWRVPLVGLGDAVVADYHITHRGGPNASPELRSLLYIIYSRRWFRDLNFDDSGDQDKKYGLDDDSDDNSDDDTAAATKNKGDVNDSDSDDSDDVDNVDVDSDDSDDDQKEVPTIKKESADSDDTDTDDDDRDDDEDEEMEKIDETTKPATATEDNASDDEDDDADAKDEVADEEMYEVKAKNKASRQSTSPFFNKWASGLRYAIVDETVVEQHSRNYKNPQQSLAKVQDFAGIREYERKSGNAQFVFTNVNAEGDKYSVYIDDDLKMKGLTANKQWPVTTKIGRTLRVVDDESGETIRSWTVTPDQGQVVLAV